MSVNLFGIRHVSRLGIILIVLTFISILSMIIGLLYSKGRADDLEQNVPGLTGLQS